MGLLAAQLIYTKTEASPWQKSGYHTAFYTLDLLARADLLEIEQHIHWPTGVKTPEKIAAFYLKKQDGHYLVVLHFRDLSQDTDRFGRGGVFLCHGFVFPPEIWGRTASALDAFELVRKGCFEDLETLLASPQVDKKTGNIAPIELEGGDSESLSENPPKSPFRKGGLSAPPLGEEGLSAPPFGKGGLGGIFAPSTAQELNFRTASKSSSKALPDLRGEQERQLVVFLNRVAAADGQRPKLTVRGGPAEVAQVADRLCAFVPDALKVQLGWDAAHDGGNLFFSPFRIAGYSQTRPSGGDEVHLDLQTGHLERSAEAAAWFTPQTAYERWLFDCWRDIKSTSQIEEAYALSEFLRGKAGKAPAGAPVGFSSSNRELIRDSFTMKCGELMGRGLAPSIAGAVDAPHQLELMVEGLPKGEMAALLESVVVTRRLAPGTVKCTLPEALVAAGRPILRLLAQAWHGQAPGRNVLRELDLDQRKQLVAYFLLTDWALAPWLAEFLKEDQELFDRLFLTSDTHDRILKIVEREALQKKQYGVATAIIVGEAAHRVDMAYLLLTGELDPAPVVERFLAQGEWDEKDLKTLLNWAKPSPPPVGEYPYVQSYLYPGRGISPELMSDDGARSALLNCLVGHHHFEAEQLAALGFQEEELSLMRKKPSEAGLFSKAKALFKFGR